LRTGRSTQLARDWIARELPDLKIGAPSTASGEVAISAWPPHRVGGPDPPAPSSSV